MSLTACAWPSCARAADIRDLVLAHVDILARWRRPEGHVLPACVINARQKAIEETATESTGGGAGATPPLWIMLDLPMDLVTTPQAQQQQQQQQGQEQQGQCTRAAQLTEFRWKADARTGLVSKECLALRPFYPQRWVAVLKYVLQRDMRPSTLLIRGKPPPMDSERGARPPPASSTLPLPSFISSRSAATGGIGAMAQQAPMPVVPPFPAPPPPPNAYMNAPAMPEAAPATSQPGGTGYGCGGGGSAWWGWDQRPGRPPSAMGGGGRWNPRPGASNCFGSKGGGGISHDDRGGDCGGGGGSWGGVSGRWGYHERNDHSDRGDVWERGEVWSTRHNFWNTCHDNQCYGTGQMAGDGWWGLSVDRTIRPPPGLWSAEACAPAPPLWSPGAPWHNSNEAERPWPGGQQPACGSAFGNCWSTGLWPQGRHGAASPSLLL
eukprot:NODE_5735_length_1740_cov_3.608803.p1 GENE.NODE_5735_length_1740_cov_3.608803~~NODE_5735_length_1740_cov_3.608803.p1  ORF type:complete len:456 (-),score=72.56 NODE_5735_length_1740_cov_3.608803:371-1678(-)